MGILCALFIFFVVLNFNYFVGYYEIMLGFVVLFFISHTCIDVLEHAYTYTVYTYTYIYSYIYIYTFMYAYPLVLRKGFIRRFLLQQEKTKDVFLTTLSILIDWDSGRI